MLKKDINEKDQKLSNLILHIHALDNLVKEKDKSIEDMNGTL